METRLVYDVFHLPFWGMDIALDMFLGGMGVGAFLFAVGLFWFFGDRLKQVTKLAAYVAPVCVVLGFIFLVLHLGHPFRFYKVLLTFNFTSPIYCGAYLQSIFLALSLAYALMWYSDGHPEKKFPAWIKSSKVRLYTGVAGIPIATCVGLYYGYLLMVFKARPIWNTGPIIVMAVCSFILTGISLVILILSMMPKAEEMFKEMEVSRNILGGAIVLQIFTILLWMSSLYFGPGDSHHGMIRLMTEFGLMFWGGVMFLGLVLPLLIGIKEIFRERKTGKVSVSVAAVCSTMILIGGFFLRYVIILVEQS